MNKKKRFNNKRHQNKPKHRINTYIRADEIRLVGEYVIGNAGDIVSKNAALRLAEDSDLDLVEINGKSEPPVCKIIDYKKFLFEQKKKEDDQKKAQRLKNKGLKEVRFTSNTGDGDIERKTNDTKEFLEKGHKVKLSVLFKGRNIQYKERGELILLNIAESLNEIAKVESLDQKVVNRKLHMTLAPKKKN